VKTETSASREDDTIEALRAADRETDPENDDVGLAAVTAVVLDREIIKDNDVAEVEAKNVVIKAMERVRIERRRKRFLWRSKYKN
jgi:hypothetical protein